MTSIKQIEANRRNAQHSTGPTSFDGKKRSSRNAVRHGLTAETVIVPIEDVEDYQAFEEAVAASFDPETAVERELILRLASLLWRLRRATSIETGLFQLSRDSAVERGKTLPSGHLKLHLHTLAQIGAKSVPSLRPQASVRYKNPIDAEQSRDKTLGALSDTQPLLARRFLGLSDLDGAFERISRYELALWRQVRQTVYTLNALQRRPRQRQRGQQHRFYPSDAFDPDLMPTEED